MTKTICKSTADDSRGCIFAEVVYVDDVTKYRHMLIQVSRYFLRRYIIVGHWLIPRIPGVYACLSVCLSVCPTGNQLEEHDDDAISQTGNRRKAVSRTCIEKYAI